MSPRKLEPVEPGSHLPGWIVAQYDGRGESETPLWLPEQRALIFADALTAPAGELRVWATPWHLVRASPAGIAVGDYNSDGLLDFILQEDIGDYVYTQK